MYLFVYGTLKHGFGLNQFLVQSGSQYKGWAYCNDLRLYSWGQCPGAYPHVGGKVWGEVYEIEPAVIKSVDKIEAAYVREEREVHITEGSLDLNPVTAWIYLSTLNPVGGEWIVDGIFNIHNLRYL